MLQLVVKNVQTPQHGPQSKIKQLIHRAQKNYSKNTQKMTSLSEQIEVGGEPEEILGNIIIYPVIFILTYNCWLVNSLIGGFRFGCSSLLLIYGES